jgi:hypothetical protein
MPAGFRPALPDLLCSAPFRFCRAPTEVPRADRNEARRLDTLPLSPLKPRAHARPAHPLDVAPAIGADISGRNP